MPTNNELSTEDFATGLVSMLARSAPSDATPVLAGLLMDEEASDSMYVITNAFSAALLAEEPDGNLHRIFQELTEYIDPKVRGGSLVHFENIICKGHPAIDNAALDMIEREPDIDALHTMLEGVRIRFESRRTDVESSNEDARIEVDMRFIYRILLVAQDLALTIRHAKVPYEPRRSDGRVHWERQQAQAMSAAYGNESTSGD